MTEIWKSLIIDNIDTKYEISSYGSIRNSNHDLLDNKFIKSGRYNTFTFKFGKRRKKIIIHRYVALLFLDNPRRLKYIKHIDGNLFNNRIDNLEWNTSQYCNSDKPKIVDSEQDKVVEIQPQINTDEIWRPIYINNEITNYKVSKFGQVCISSTLKLRSLSTITGYKTCSIFHNNKRYTRQVHRLVAETFIPISEPNKNHVHHKNGNKMDNNVENLEWVTISKINKNAHKNDERKTTKIPIIRWELDNTNPTKYESISKAMEEYGSSVIECLAGRMEHSRGYKWTYEDISHKKDTKIDLSAFKQIDNHPYFLISIDGQVYSKLRNIFIIPRLIGNYMSIVIDKKQLCIHRLLATHFLDKPEKYNDNWIVIHKDGNKLNNDINNLKWISPSDIINYTYENSTRSNTRIIVQKDLNDNIIQEYSNATQAAKTLGKNVNSQILRACKNKDKCILYGYKWEYKK